MDLPFFFFSLIINLGFVSSLDTLIKTNGLGPAHGHNNRWLGGPLWLVARRAWPPSGLGGKQPAVGPLEEVTAHRGASGACLQLAPASS